MSLSPREMLARLIAFPSVSTSSNLDIIGFCQEWLQSQGVESRLVMSPEGDKANLYATIGPQVEGGIVLSGHTDVVPVEGQNWSTDPWTLTEKNGRLYGRGTADMKGFDALVLALVPEMVRAPLKRPVHIALSYDEEIACRGAPSMVREMAGSVATPSAVESRSACAVARSWSSGMVPVRKYERREAISQDVSARYVWPATGTPTSTR